MSSAWKSRWVCALDESLTMVPMVDIDWHVSLLVGFSQTFGLGNQR